VNLEIGLMVEGQEGVSWPQWLDLARIAEQQGFAFLYRSDHYLSERKGSNRDSLDAWGTICGLAAVTSRIRLGTLVSPVTFRHPSVLAKLAVTADHISAGRIDVGIGAGWYQEEHVAYGFEMAELRVRMEILEEQLEIITRSWGDDAFTFEGRHYNLSNVDARPKPTQARPRLILGGLGGPRSLAFAAEWADEYNLSDVTDEQIGLRRTALAEACERRGRDPASVHLSMLTGVLTGTDRSEIEERAVRVSGFLGCEPASPDEALSSLPGTWIIGTPDEVGDRLAVLASLGISRIMLWLPLHDDLEMIELIGREVLPRWARH
jgi:alkanesulfonate monooxygenase SsuD/methylene tetrahydromethanopterin reductase-like flavin-dependent oxidoreductase (luciferase family)